MTEGSLRSLQINLPHKTLRQIKRKRSAVWRLMAGRRANDTGLPRDPIISTLSEPPRKPKMQRDKLGKVLLKELVKLEEDLEGGNFLAEVVRGMLKSGIKSSERAEIVARH